MSEEFNNYGTPSNGPESKGMAIASMVLGIVSIVCCWMWYVCLPCGIIGLVLSILFKRNNGEAIGMSKAGMLCSIIGIALCIVVWVLAILGLGLLGASLSQMGY